MKNPNQRPLEDEFRSSQVYKTLSGSGSYVADKIAEGLGKAAEGIDSALNGKNPAFRRGTPPAGNYYPPGPGPQNARRGGPMPGAPYQPYQGRPQTGPQGGNGQYAARPNPGPDGYYHYRGTPQQTAQTRRAAPPPPPPPPPQPAYRPPKQPSAQRPAGVNPAPAPQMKLVRRPSVAKYYVTGVTALLYALTMPMSEPAHFAVFAIVEVLIFLLSGLLFKGKKEFVPAEAEKPKEEPKKPEPEKPSSTGNPEVDKIIDEGNGYLKKLRAANDAIPDEALSDCIDRMERASADIFHYISENPAKAPQIRKFMNYYLPTTLKLLGSYQRLASQSVKGETITSTMFNIAGMMHTVADAFEKQLDSLFSDEAMDISADITVFETLLKQEGFVEDKKEEG